MDMWGGPGLGGRDGYVVWSRAGRTRWRCSVVQSWEVVMDVWGGRGLGGCDGDAMWSRRTGFWCCHLYQRCPARLPNLPLILRSFCRHCFSNHPMKC